MIPRTRIKICGLTREVDVDAAVSAGADAVGFVLYERSPRCVSVERAAELARRLPPFVMPVALLVNASDAELDAIQAPLGEWFSRHTNQELYDLACEFNLFLAPVMSPREMLVNAQLASRDYFASLGGYGRFPHRFVVTSSADGEAAPTAATEAAPALGSSVPTWTRKPAQLPATGADYGTGAWAGVNILEFGSGAIRQCKAVTRIFPTIAAHLEGTPDSAGGQHHCLRLPQLEAALLPVVSASSCNPIPVEQQAEYRALHVDMHPGMDAVVLECAYHLQAGAVANVGEPRVSVPAEVSLKNLAVCRAIEKRAPCLEFADAFRSFFGMEFGHAPVVQVLTATHRIGEMNPPAIAIVDVGQCCRDASFGHYGMRFAQQRLGDHGYACACGKAFYRGTQSGAARANDQDVMLMSFILRLVRHNILKSLIMPLATMRT